MSIMREFIKEINELALEVNYLQQEVKELREYKKKYFELLDSSINHNQIMAGHVLKLMLGKGDNS